MMHEGVMMGMSSVMALNDIEREDLKEYQQDAYITY